MIHILKCDELVQMMDEYILKLEELMNKDPIMASELAMASLIATGMWDKNGNYIGLEKLNE